MNETSRLSGVLRAAGTGAVTGLVGGAVMVVGEKIWQAVTHRPNSCVLARALLTLLGNIPVTPPHPSSGIT